ncbi:sensor domain-containing diguanylate cyclase [Halomonas faecis]|uniref:sensor domain-containing diguanylate cyclase n=1 Tax=Halomonas faecis TaxID=1562110 RepID=UPI0013D752C4|nr:sensor domain-containing diguanylate cyclase [Halomonas faecis]
MDSLETDLVASDYRAALAYDPRAIQPCGCLMAVDRQWRRIRLASTNLADFLDLPQTDVLSLSPHQLLGASLIEALQHQLSRPSTPRASRRLTGRRRSLLVTAHGSAVTATLEIEPLENLDDDLTGRGVAWGRRFDACHDPQQLESVLLQAVQEITGHAHACIRYCTPGAGGLEAGTGLRMVADTQAKPVPLIGDTTVDASLAFHALPDRQARQLRRRAVRSVLAFPLHDETPASGGLLIGYSAIPRYLAPPVRQLLQLVAQAAWQRHQLLEERSNLRRRQRLLDAYECLGSEGMQHLSIRSLREAGQTWLEIFQASGMLLTQGDQINGIGTHPEKSTLGAILRFLDANGRRRPWSHDDLANTPLANDLTADAAFAGLLAVPLRTGNDATGWLLLFRRATPSGTSLPWQPADLHQAQELARLLSADMTLCQARQLAKRLQEHNTTLARLAHTDPVTQVANRHRIEQVLDAELLACEHSHEPCSLLLFDVDHFKRINDTHGHDAGDRVLYHLAQETLARLRTSDHLGRWGGEEFLIIAPNCTLHAAADLARRLCDEIAELPMPFAGPISASFGVTQWSAGDTPKSIVRRADLAMYQAKQAGRSRVRTA